MRREKEFPIWMKRYTGAFFDFMGSYGIKGISILDLNDSLWSKTYQRIIFCASYVGKFDSHLENLFNLLDLDVNEDLVDFLIKNPNSLPLEDQLLTGLNLLLSATGQKTWGGNFKTLMKELKKEVVMIQNKALTSLQIWIISFMKMHMLGTQVWSDFFSGLADGSIFLLGDLFAQKQLGNSIIDAFFKSAKATTRAHTMMVKSYSSLAYTEEFTEFLKARDLSAERQNKRKKVVQKSQKSKKIKNSGDGDL